MRVARKRRPAAPRRPRTQLDRVHALNRRGNVTVDEYLALGEDDGPYRLELIDGRIDVTSSPNSRHQKLVMRLARILEDRLEETGKGEVYYDLDTVLDGRTSLRPDIVFVSKKRANIVGDRIYGAPDLVVEVLSESTREKDLGIKQERYASAGVPSYWIVDPETETIRFHRLRRGKYVVAAHATAPAKARAPGLPGLTIPLGKLFAARPR